MVNAFSSPAAGGQPARQQAPARRPGLGQSVNGWVNQAATQVPSLAAVSGPAPEGQMTTQVMPSDGSAITPAPEGTMQTTSAPVPQAPGEHPPEIPGVPAPLPPTPPIPGTPDPTGRLGRHSLHQIRQTFPDWRAQKAEFQSLDPAGKASMIQSWITANPQFAQLQPQLEAWLNRGPRSRGGFESENGRFLDNEQRRRIGAYQSTGNGAPQV